MDRVQLAVCESRKRREGLSSFTLQEEEQLCECELCFLIYNKASVQTCSTFENISVCSCKIFLVSQALLMAPYFSNSSPNSVQFTGETTFD